MVLFFTSPRILKGPNRSIAVEDHGGAGLRHYSGDFPMTWPVSFFSIFLHTTQLNLIDFTILCSPGIQYLERTLLAVAAAP